MAEIAPSELKTILHSKRANLYYLEHCRVLVNGGRVEYVTDQGKRSLYWNIPIANTTTVLLGTGTSITQAAMRELAKAGVLVGFAGGGGTPLFSANEVDIEVAWFSPQSEYRPIEYLQAWVRFWFDDDLRLAAAKAFQQKRVQRIRPEFAAAQAAQKRMPRGKGCPLHFSLHCGMPSTPYARLPRGVEIRVIYRRCRRAWQIAIRLVVQSRCAMQFRCVAVPGGCDPPGTVRPRQRSMPVRCLRAEGATLRVCLRNRRRRCDRPARPR